MQNDGDVTIVYTRLVKFKHPMDMAFIHKYITTSLNKNRLRRVANMMPASQNPAGFKYQVDTPADIPYA